MIIYKQKNRKGRGLFLICFFAFLFLLLAPAAKAEGASFRLRAAGEEKGNFIVEVLVDSKDVSLNAAQATIRFSPEKVQISEISIKDSIFQLWFQEPVFSNSNGTIFFGGGLPSPGFQGEGGLIFTIVFSGKAEGKAEMHFENEIATANDPAGKNIFSSSQGETYSVSPSGKISQEAEYGPKEAPPLPTVKSPSHPQQDQWYMNRNPEFQWDLTPDITEVAFAFNQTHIFEPDLTKELFDSERFYLGVEDGVWYFHIKLKNNNGWSETARFKVQIDNQPPNPPEVIIDNKGDLTNPHPSLYLKSEDELSGVNYFKILIDDKTFFAALDEVSPFPLPFLMGPGEHLVEVEAVDRARNVAQGSSEIKVEPIEPPKITVCPNLFISGEEIIYLAGTALPDSEVIVSLEKDGKLIKEWMDLSDKSGYWSLVKKDLLPSGNYKISARTRDGRGAKSNSSDPCFIGVILSGFSLGPIMIVYKSLAFFGLILFFAMLAGLVYFVWKFKKTRKSIDKEIEDLKLKFYKEYKELQSGMERELEILRTALGGGEAGPEERRREEELLKDLSDIKEVLEKELKDIEEL